MSSLTETLYVTRDAILDRVEITLVKEHRSRSTLIATYTENVMRS